MGGTVIASVDGREECIEHATATLRKDGQEIGAAQSDAFGEFKIDGLSPDSGDYQVEIAHSQFGSASTTARLGEVSIYLGELRLLN